MEVTSTLMGLLWTSCACWRTSSAGPALAQTSSLQTVNGTCLLLLLQGPLPSACLKAIGTSGHPVELLSSASAWSSCHHDLLTLPLTSTSTSICSYLHYFLIEIASVPSHQPSLVNNLLTNTFLFLAWIRLPLQRHQIGPCKPCPCL